MNLVDSSGWLEYFSGGRNASFFEPALKDTGHLVVSAINLYEVFKTILRQRGENEALEAAAAMQNGVIADVDSIIAVAASQISIELKLPMAESLIYATARQRQAILWTQDEDFAGFKNVRFIHKTGLKKRNSATR
jgi:predicted nucleic acid-binding protein